MLNKVKYKYRWAMFIEINKNYKDVSERPANDTSCRQVSQIDQTRIAEHLIPQTRTRSLMNHCQPAKSLGCSIQVEEPVGCDARAYSDHSPTSSHNRREMDYL